MFYKAFKNIKRIFSSEKMQLKFERSVCLFFRLNIEHLPQQNDALEMLRETLYLCFDKEICNNDAIPNLLEKGLVIVKLNYDLFLNRLANNIDHFDLSPDEYFTLFPRFDKDL